MVGRVGLEPTANGLKGRCSTIELPTQRSGFAPEARKVIALIRAGKFFYPAPFGFSRRSTAAMLNCEWKLADWVTPTST